MLPGPALMLASVSTELESCQGGRFCDARSYLQYSEKTTGIMSAHWHRIYN